MQGIIGEGGEFPVTCQRHGNAGAFQRRLDVADAEFLEGFALTQDALAEHVGHSLFEGREPLPRAFEFGAVHAAPVGPHPDATSPVAGAFRDGPELRFVPEQARIEPDPGDPGVDGREGRFPVELDVRQQRHGGIPDDFGEIPFGPFVVHGHPDQVAAQCRAPFDLRKGPPGVGQGHVGHGLDRNGEGRTDPHEASVNGSGRSSRHGRRSLPGSFPLRVRRGAPRVKSPGSAAGRRQKSRRASGPRARSRRPWKAP